MFRIRPICFLAAGLSLVLLNQHLMAADPRTVTSFDSNWRFIQQDAGAAKAPGFDDSAWRQLDVPHDWSIEQPASQNNPAGGAGGFFPDGIGWYRKSFALNDQNSTKRIFIDFDGVMANSDVYINGFLLGHRPSGYAPLHYELTGHLNFGQGRENVIAVRCDESAEPASRYYTGAGIIGHVHLVIENPVHFEHDSLYVTTPKIGADEAVVHVQATVTNQSNDAANVIVQVELVGPDGQSVGTKTTSQSKSINAGKSLEVSQDIPVTNPELWDLDHPQIYRAQVTLLDGNQAVDDDAASFGIRSIKFTPENGFFLNGKNVRLQGVCLHADVSCFGTAVPISAWEHRLAALKPFGINALRTAHNPPSPEFLDLCDRMGFVVMDEMFDCWDVGKNRFDYHLDFDKWSLTDLGDAVRRDRNHPSIILYSAGNEIHDTPNAQASIRILTGLVKEFHENDPSRPVTQALLRPNNSHDYTDGLADLLDVVGTNYRMKELVAAQQDKPSRLIIGTENGIGDVGFLAEHPQLAGIFVWSGVDYIGEAKAWPTFSNGSGLFNRIDEPKGNAYLARTSWSQTPFIHIARGNGRDVTPPATKLDGDETPPVDVTPPAAQPGVRRRRPGGAVAEEGGPGPSADWTPTNQNPHAENVAVYSNCARVLLTLNGTSIPESRGAGRGGNGIHTFSVPFAPGVLKAVGIGANGDPVATDELHTAGKAVKILLSSDTKTLPHDWDDVSFVKVEITDADGVVVPNSDQEITFNVTGPGVIATTDSADNKYREPFTSTRRATFLGKCLAIVKSKAESGTITLTASASGLEPGSINIEATPAAR